MRHEEEVETTFDNFCLLNESVVHICALRRVQDVGSVRALLCLLLEESLSHTLVDDDECGVGKSDALTFRVVLVCEDLLQLIELKIDDFLAHGIADTVTIDEDVIRETSSVEVAVGLQGTSEIFLEDVGRYNFLTLLSLMAGLSVVLTHVLIIGGDETNDALLALVANVDTYEHGLVGDLRAEVHSPEIASQFGIDLSHDVEIDAVVVTVDCF